MINHQSFILLSAIIINGAIVALVYMIWRLVWQKGDELEISFDGMTLIKFQRNILIGFIISGIIYGIGIIVMKVVGLLLNDYQKLFLTLNIVPNQDFIITSFLLIIILVCLIELKWELQNYFQPIDDMKIRSLHISGLPLDDWDGVQTMLEILKYLHDIGDPGTIVAISMLPDYSELLYYDNIKFQEEYMQKVLEAGKIIFKPNITQNIEHLIQKALEKEYKMSGHCFIMVDRIATKNNLIGASQRQLVLKNIDQVPDIYDINWLNIMTEGRGAKFWRTVILNTIIVTLLIFVTSPNALYYYLSKFPGLEFLSFNWTIQIPDPFGKIIKNNIPPLLVISINQVVLYLLDIITMSEKNIRYSGYQISFLQKMYFYLLLNVLVIPAFFIQSSDTLFDITYNGFNFNLKQTFNDDNLQQVGEYYFTFLMQSGSVSFCVQMMRPSELWFNYMSPFLANYMRIYEHDVSLHRRTNEYCLQYGYITAQMLLILSIVCIFSISSPLVILGGIWFFSLRLISDTYSLKYVNKREIESDGRYLKILLQLTIFTLGLWLLIKIISCWLIQTNMMYMFIVELILLTIIGIYLSQLDQNRQDEDIKNRVDYHELLREWKMQYKHPLFSGS